MISDALQIDGFNPTTWTGDFGINKDGFPKDMPMDQSYTTGIDPRETDYTDTLTHKPRDLAGNMYLHTLDPKYAPHEMFPTRKFEYSDGTVTWYREAQRWPWMGHRPAVVGSSPGEQKKLRFDLLDSPTVQFLLILIAVMYFVSKLI